MVLSQMESSEPGLVGEPDEIEPILEQPVRRRARNILDVVEDAEGWCGHDDASSRRRVRANVTGATVASRDITRVRLPPPPSRRDSTAGR